MARRPVKWSMTRAVGCRACRPPSPRSSRASSTRLATTRIAPIGQDSACRRRNRRARRDGALDGHGPERPRRRCAVPLHLRSRCRRHLAPAHRQPYERDGGARRPGTSACGSPCVFADVGTGTSVDVVAVDPQGQRGGRRDRHAHARSHPVELGPARRRQRLLHLGNRAHRGAVRRVDGATSATPGERQDRDAGGRLLSAPRDGSGRRRPPDADRHVDATRSARATRPGSATITTASRSSPRRKTWKPGERARIMIQSPWETATALLTVEREGIRRHRSGSR